MHTYIHSYIHTYTRPQFQQQWTNNTIKHTNKIILYNMNNFMIWELKNVMLNLLTKMGVRIIRWASVSKWNHNIGRVMEIRILWTYLSLTLCWITCWSLLHTRLNQKYKHRKIARYLRVNREQLHSIHPSGILLDTTCLYNSS